MASRIHRVWATCCRQTLQCLQNHWRQGETGSIWWNTALVLPLPFSQRREARKRKNEEQLKRNWKRIGRGASRRKGRESQQDELCKAVRAGYCWRCWLLKGASPDRHQLHQPLSPLPMAESRLICAPANGQQQDEEAGKGLATWWQVDCLGGTQRQRQVHSLLPLFTEVTDWADLYSSPVEI